MTTCDFTKNDLQNLFPARKKAPKNGTSRTCIYGSSPPRAIYSSWILLERRWIFHSPIACAELIKTSLFLEQLICVSSETHSISLNIQGTYGEIAACCKQFLTFGKVDFPPYVSQTWPNSCVLRN